MITQARQTLILDDGEYYVTLAAHQAANRAVAFLERRCAVSEDSPSGTECLGAVTPANGGGWDARLAARFDPVANTDFTVVATGAPRIDAIVALWRARRAAFIPRQNHLGDR